MAKRRQNPATQVAKAFENVMPRSNHVEFSANQFLTRRKRNLVVPHGKSWDSRPAPSPPHLYSSSPERLGSRMITDSLLTEQLSTRNQKNQVEIVIHATGAPRRSWLKSMTTNNRLTVLIRSRRLYRYKLRSFRRRRLSVGLDFQ
jgi:hypothetical protein